MKFHEPDFSQTSLKLEKIARAATAADSAHDLSHSERVLKNALRIAEIEGGDPEVLIAAAYLHDIANLPKSHPESHLSSERSSARAAEILTELGMSTERIEAAHDAILCHSYSRGLTPKTLEGRVFQDADRLDALGAIGIARTFAVGGATHRPLYSRQDAFGKQGRRLDDKQNTLDHFEIKLFKIPALMQTATGTKLAEQRVQAMRNFMTQLAEEITNDDTLGARV
jgi:uncharacterized protein